MAGILLRAKLGIIKEALSAGVLKPASLCDSSRTKPSTSPGDHRRIMLSSNDTIASFKSAANFLNTRRNDKSFSVVSSLHNSVLRSTSRPLGRCAITVIVANLKCQSCAALCHHEAG